ncbi:hypothetical protein C2S53_013213 [Perilla frutescens var. hirtella]|uniref:Uncharacterized protein n=1 Tax=Perilla frutescens var. hirtella TaxID=608512 RepID=A0AAD4J9H2_PERFH|nr:hypothetical protein C2S53_013213 [Perilla frutescens var. hirtella]
MDMDDEVSLIETLVSEVKKEILLNVDAFVSPSAYDTAWLAMIPHEQNPNAPMFDTCLNWILQNQNEAGFWGEINDHDLPTIDALTATLACSIALKFWNAGHQNIQSGLSFIQSKAELLVKINYQNLPRWFVLTFPAMIELAEAAGLHLLFPPGLIAVIAHIFIRRHHILQTEELVQVEGQESRYFPPLLSYLETLPSTYEFDRQETVKRYLSSDGSLFQSPSATAQAFICTGNSHSLKYLRSLVQNFPNGVPARYPVDGDLIKLCMVDHVQGLGLAAHFNEEIEQLVAQVYRNRKNEKSNPSVSADSVPIKLFKDALAFRLLRMQKHYVHPGSFCWFLHEPETMSYMEENCEQFMSAMYSIKYELDVPWAARLDRLYHRKWIEENKISPLWIGKASYYRLSCLDNKKLMQLAVENFEFQQSIYQQELEELKRWSKKWRLSEMGFGREKTVYTYFSIASAWSCIAYYSMMRLVAAKAAIIVTVADDFYDMEGSLPDLEILTHAVQRYVRLDGHSKTIFEALDDFVNETAATYHPQQAAVLLPMLQDLWRETFMSWMVERRWSVRGDIPSMDEYLETGMVSIAAHTIILPVTTFFNQNGTTPPPYQYQNITKLLMLITRLANDIQSYQKEVEDGKMNLVMLQGGSIEDSVAHVKQIQQVKRKEFLQLVFTDSFDEEEEMPDACKKIHLYSMKVFEMFFNSANLFDSETALLEDINRSLYLPIHRKPKPKPDNHFVIPSPSPRKSKVSARFHAISKLPPVTVNSIKNFSVADRGKVQGPMRFNLRFMALPL